MRSSSVSGQDRYLRRRGREGIRTRRAVATAGYGRTRKAAAAAGYDGGRRQSPLRDTTGCERQQPL